MDWGLYRARNVVERLVGRLKEYRRVATRYDKTGVSYPPSSTLPRSGSGYESGLGLQNYAPAAPSARYEKRAAIYWAFIILAAIRM